SKARDEVKASATGSAPSEKRPPRALPAPGPPPDAVTKRRPRRGGPTRAARVEQRRDVAHDAASDVLAIGVTAARMAGLLADRQGKAQGLAEAHGQPRQARHVESTA